MPTFKDLQTNLPKLKKNKNPPSLVERDVYVTVDGESASPIKNDYRDDIHINVTTDQAANTVNINSMIQPQPDSDDSKQSLVIEFAQTLRQALQDFLNKEEEEEEDGSVNPIP
jgi:hypothetical protein